MIKIPVIQQGAWGVSWSGSHDGAAVGYSARTPSPATEREAGGPVERAPPDPGASTSPVVPGLYDLGMQIAPWASLSFPV